MQQYFVKGKPASPFHVTDKDTAKHMFSVMRLLEEEQVYLVFEDEQKYKARLLNREEQTFELIEKIEKTVELPLHVTIAIGFPKGDKLDWVSQKATELGADQIWAFPADRSVVKWDRKKLLKKQEKLEKIVQGAAEQSKRTRIPRIQLFETMSSFLDEWSQFDAVLVAYEESAKQGEKAQFLQAVENLSKGQSLLLVFGAEGGLSKEEITIFKEKGAKTIGLGPRIMRAETAPLYALSAISLLTELAVE